MRSRVVSLAFVLKPVAVVAVLFATTAQAFGQVTPARRVDFDEAVRLALERNPDVANAATAINRAETVLQRTQSFLKPAVNATMTNTTLDGSRGFAGSTTQPQNQFSFGADVSLPLVAPTQRSQVNQARDQIEVATLSSTEVRRQIAIATGQTYLVVIASRRQIEVDMRALESARAHFDYAQKRFEGGAGSRLNQIRAGQQVAADEARLEVTRLALARAQEALGVLLAEDGPVDAAAEPVFDVPATINEAEWMAARTDLKLQAANIHAAERVVADAQKEWLPKAAVSFRPALIAPSSAFSPPRTWALTFLVSQRVFDTSQRADKALKQVALSQTKFARSAVEIQARSQVRIAQAAVQALERAWTSARLAADQANEVLRITTSAFEFGATTNIEVIDAQRTARDTESAATLSEDAIRRAKLDLLIALGRFPR